MTYKVSEFQWWKKNNSARSTSVKEINEINIKTLDNAYLTVVYLQSFE
jgi:hypothetical protein